MNWLQLSADEVLRTRRQILYEVLRSIPLQQSVESYNYMIEHELRPLVEDAYSKLETTVGHKTVKYSISNIFVQYCSELSVDDIASRNDALVADVRADVVFETLHAKTGEVLYRSKQDQVLLFAIPVMIGSCLSPTRYHPVHTGTFSVRGNMRVFVGHHRAFNNRIMLQHKNGFYQLEYRAETAHIKHRSTNTLKLMVRTDYTNKYIHKNWIIQLHISWLKKPAPLAMVLRALGHTYEEFMVVMDHVLPSAKDYAGVFQRLEKMMIQWTTEDALHQYAKQHMKDTQLYNRERCIHVARNQLQTMLLSNITMGDRAIMANLAPMVRELILYASGHKKRTTDRDAQFNQEVDDVGPTLANVLRQKLRQYILTKIKIFRKALYNHSGNTLHSDFTIKKVIDDQLTSKLVTFVNTGKVSDNRTGVTQLVNTTNYLSLMTHKRKTVSTLKGKEGTHKNSRRLDRDSFGFLCAPDTPDSQDVGLSYNRALCARITPDIDTESVLYVVKVLLKDLFTSLEEQLVCEQPKVYFHGVWIGYIQDLELGSTRLHQAKNKWLNPFVAIWIEDGCLWISSRAGRHVIPMIRVASPPLNTDYTELMHKGIIEWLDPKEIRCLPFYSIAIQPQNMNPQTRYLCLLDPVYLGPIALTLPFINHDTGPRATYYCQMVRQSISIPPPVQAIDRYRLHYPERPLISTHISRFYGFDREQPLTNARIVLYSDPAAVEDAIVLSADAVRRMFYYATSKRLHQVERSKKNAHKAQFKKPNIKNTIGLSQSCEYMHENGLPKLGKVLQKGDPIIGSTTKTFSKGIPRSKHKDIYTTSSQQITQDQQHYEKDNSQHMQETMGRVVYTASHSQVHKVITETDRAPQVGDKGSNQHAGKGVFSTFRENYEMPFEPRTNTRVDAIFCIEGLPSRMITGLLREMILGKAAALSGQSFDDDHEFDAERRQKQLLKAQDILKEHGFHPEGLETFINPFTGEEMRPLMTGVISMQRLTHLVQKKAHTRATGPINIFTRQPVTGRRKGGGQKNGYMEIYANVNHGQASFLWARNVVQSDPNPSFAYCTQCGYRSTYNPQLQKGWCHVCRRSDTLVARLAPYSLSLLQNYLAATGIKMIYRQKRIKSNP